MRYEEMIKKNFAKHTAEHVVYKAENNEEIETLRWKNKDNRVYNISYIRKDNVLFVTGDMGEAVYRWGSCENLEWISQCDISYFAGKCEASETGRGYEDWDMDVAKKNLKEYIEEYDEEKAEEKLSAFEDSFGPSAMFSKWEWDRWLFESGYEVLGGDFGEWAGGIGIIISLRCEAHLIGLKMAFAQLKKNEVKAKS